MIVRKFRFAGPNNFYPDNTESIETFIHKHEKKVQSKCNAFSIICPHAGYIFSAQTAIRVLEKVKVPDHIILIGPNHTGEGASPAIMTEGEWEVPGDTIKIDSNLADTLLKGSLFLKNDPIAHKNEHSLEVLLPLLHYFNKNMSFVPITMGDYSLEVIKDLKDALIKTASIQSTNFLVIASTDMSHFVSRKVAERKDELAFAAIRNLDSISLLETVRENNITMCGSGPVAVSIDYAKHRGAKKATLVDYTDSGYVTGDTLSVVSYAGFIVE